MEETMAVPVSDPSSSLQESLQLAKTLEVFAYFDKDGDGRVHKSQLYDMLVRLNKAPSPADTKRLIENIGKDSDDCFTAAAFLTLLSSIPPGELTVNKDDLYNAFAVFADGRQTISVNRLTEVLTTLGDIMSDAEIRRLVDLAEPDDGDGISFDKLAHLLS